MGSDRAGGDPTPRAGDGGPYRKTPTQLASDSAFTGTYATRFAKRAMLTTPIRASRTMIQSFQSGHGWTVSSAASSNLNDTTDYALGSQSAKFVTNTTATTVNFDSPTLTAIDCSGKSVALLIKIDGYANVSNLRLYAADSAFANYRNFNLGLVETRANAGYIHEGEWQWVKFNWLHGSVPGTDPRAAVTKFRLAVTTTAGTQATVHVGAVALEAESSRFPSGLVSVCFDDGRLSPFSNARAKLDSLGWSATAYPIVDKVGTNSYVTTAQLKALKDYSGWEIGVHAYSGVNHDAGFDTLTLAQVESELELSRQWISDNNLGTGEGLAWPLGVATGAMEDVARRTCAYARGNVTQSREGYPPASQFRIRSEAVGNTTTQTTLQGYVDQVFTSKGWLCLTFHEITTPGTNVLEWPTASFNSLMDYIATKGCTVLPVAEALRAYGAP